MKKMMILGAGIYQLPLINAARRLGFETIAVSIPGNYPGFQAADRVLLFDTRDKEQVLKAAAEEKVAGICTTGTDVAVSSIGYACGRLGLPGIPVRSAEVLCNKALMKEAFLKHGVRCAFGRRAYHVFQAIEIAREIGYPVVVKRVDSSGSRGITAVFEEDGMQEAFRLAAERTNQDYVLVEKMLKGIEIGVDGFIRDHKIVFFAPHAKFIYHGEHSTVPVGHTFPCPLSESALADLREQLQLAADATGADACCFNADVFMDGDQAWLIELGGRCGATCIPELIQTHYGFDYYEAMLLEASGGKAAFPSREGTVPCMAKLITSPTEGVITGIDMERLEQIRRSGIQVVIDYPVATHVFAMSDGTDRLGHVLAKTDREGVLDEAVSRVQSCIEINGKSLEELWRS